MMIVKNTSPTTQEVKEEHTMVKTFKQLVVLISRISTEDDRSYALGEIDRSFEREKISWNDHEMLYQLACKVAA